MFQRPGEVVGIGGTKWSDQENSKRGRWEEEIQKENSEYGFGITNNLETSKSFLQTERHFQQTKSCQERELTGRAKRNFV